MTLSEARQELYELVGKNSELDPSTATGQTNLDRYINRAYKEVLRWKTPAGRLYFPVQHGSTTFQALVYTGTATSATSTTLVIPTSGLQTTDDYYVEWVVKITSGEGAGQIRYVTDWVGSTGTLTLSRAWDSTPDATSAFLLTKRFMKIVGSSDTGYVDGILLDPETVWQGPLKITDLSSAGFQDFEVAEQRENFSGNMESVGTPSEFFAFGERLVFDIAPDASRWYRLEYAKTPVSLTSVSDELQLPTPWEGAVVLRAQWWFLKRYGETEEAYSTKRDFLELVQSLARSGEDLGMRSATGTGVLE